MGLIKRLIKDVSDDQFIRAVNSSKTYTEIAKKLGAYYSNAPSVVKRRIEQLNIDFKPVSPRYEPDDVFFSEHHYHTSHTLRSRLLKVKDREYVCAVCGHPPVWNGRSLTLEVDHINGDSSDCRLANLRWICPNCHSQTGTYRRGNSGSPREYYYHRVCIICHKEFKSTSRHAKYCSKECYRKAFTKKPPIDKDDLIKRLRQTSFVQVGRDFNVTDNTVRKWCRKYNISTRSKDYK